MHLEIIKFYFQKARISVCKSDLLWVRNVKKAMAFSFRLPPVRAFNGDSEVASIIKSPSEPDSSIKNQFSLMEETIFGTCETT